MALLDRGMGTIPVVEVIEAIMSIDDEVTRRRIVEALAAVSPGRYWTINAQGNISSNDLQ